MSAATTMLKPSVLVLSWSCFSSFFRKSTVFITIRTNTEYHSRGNSIVIITAIPRVRGVGPWGSQRSSPRRRPTAWIPLSGVRALQGSGLKMSLTLRNKGTPHKMSGPHFRPPRGGHHFDAGFRSAKLAHYFAIEENLTVISGSWDVDQKRGSEGVEVVEGLAMRLWQPCNSFFFLVNPRESHQN